MIWLIIFSIIALCLFLSAYFDNEGAGFASAGLSVTVLIFFVVGFFFTTLFHAKDLESIQYHEERVEIQLERLDRLRNTLQEFDYPEGALLNHDSPISSIVSQIAETEIDIAESKEAVVKTERDIRTRKRWAFAFATRLVE